MYDFHYNYMKKTYGPNAQLLFTDTDSLCYAISTENVHQDKYAIPCNGRVWCDV
jgi:hypothetical protein